MEAKLITVEDYKALQCALTRLESKLDKLIPEQLDTVTYTPEEVCKMLDCSPKTLQNYRDKQLIDFSQVGPKIWFTAQDVQAFLNRNRIQAKGLLRKNQPNA
ncbi:helix-turn-helix domain-containing protein [Rudanella lutea]|uniref:helix-turn-helix domain-containing protein n=1 Tax=Rudanella lutea TaxID=451374 RepID=UPI00036615B0|nr:helix-turn-helix domain-containing protein [Rudanella lutea]